MPIYTTKQAPPPYVSYGVFKSTTEQLAESTVPTGPLDRRVLDWLSGGDYAALVPALRFLGLIDDDRRATDDFQRLVEVVKRPDDWKIELLAILTVKYEPIVGKLDLQKGTITELEKAFKGFGVSAGQMLTKTIRFYIKALADAKVPISPHITKPKPKTPRVPAAKNGSSKPRGGRPGTDTSHETKLPVTPEGFERMPIPGVANGFIQYPAELTEADCKMYEAMITALRAYADTRTGGKGKKP